MDLVGFDEEPFREIEADFGAFAAKLSHRRRRRDPDVGARRRQRLDAERADAVLFRPGPPRAPRDGGVGTPARPHGPFRMPVQWVCRPNAEFRGFAGPIVSGRAALGDEVVVAASGRTSRIARILVGVG